MVPRNMVSVDLPNKIGMSDMAWASCFNCAYPLACTNTTANASLNMGDQMAPFKGNSIAEAATTENTSCIFLPGLPYSFATAMGKNSIQSIRCNFTGSSLALNISLIGKSIGLSAVPKVPRTQIIASLGSWSNAITITTTAENVGYGAGNFSINVSQCCLYAEVGQIACYTVESGLKFANEPTWQQINAANIMNFLTSISFCEHNESITNITSGGNYVFCDMEMVEAVSESNTSFYCTLDMSSLSNQSSSPIIDAWTPMPPVALSFGICFGPGQSIIDQSILLAR